ncbi:MAG TPA: hypothetical protein VF587_08100, partial [Solirubrobacteraceae bacterium]
MTDRGHLVVLSDLHMAAGTHDVFAADRELEALLDDLTCAPEGPPDLLLLGDIVDFTLVEVEGRRLDTSVAGAIERLRRVVR